MNQKLMAFTGFVESACVFDYVCRPCTPLCTSELHTAQSHCTHPVYAFFSTNFSIFSTNFAKLVEKIRKLVGKMCTVDMCNSDVHCTCTVYSLHVRLRTTDNQW